MPGSISAKKQAREAFNWGKFGFFKEIYFSSSLTELKCVWKESLIWNFFVMIVVLVANAIKNAEEGVVAGQFIFGYSLGCFDWVGA